MIVFSVLFSHQFDNFLHWLILLLLVSIIMVFIFESSRGRAVLSFGSDSPFAGVAGIFGDYRVLCLIVSDGLAYLLFFKVDLHS